MMPYPDYPEYQDTNPVFLKVFKLSFQSHDELLPEETIGYFSEREKAKNFISNISEFTGKSPEWTKDILEVSNGYYAIRPVLALRINSNYYKPIHIKE